jgi:flagellin-specific chaperone FliS
MQTANSLANHKKINQYITNDITGASQEHLLIKVYDFAILHCEKKNMIKVNEAIQVLINGLNFEHEGAKQISIGFLRLYQYCQDQTRKNNFMETMKILTELRDSWKTAFNNR